MVRQLRKGNGRNGLILANGGTLTYQHVICLSSRPRNGGIPYPDHNSLPEIVTDVPILPVDSVARGEAIVEVSYDLSSIYGLLVLTRTN